MDNSDKSLDGNNISPILTLPEETMREIFKYISFETFIFSLRRVCKNIQTYVDQYLKVRGTSFLVGDQDLPEKKVMEMIEKPKEGFITLRAPGSSIPWVASKLQNKESLDKHRDRQIDMVFYLAMHEMGICSIHKSEKSFIFCYDLENDKWEELIENCSTVVQQQINSHEFIQKLISDIIPYHFEIHNYGHDHLPLVVFRIKDES